MGDMTTRELWTIGHWTCPVETFLSTLEEPGIELLVDVRAQPGSRRSPQFGQDAMAQWLPERGIAYEHLPALTGRRPRQDVDPDVNGGWQNQSFHNYADHTLSDEFSHGLAHLEARASEQRTVILCGEPMPWRCHRLLIANALVARGWTVWHLMSGSAPREHELGGWGATPVVDDGTLTYPA